MTGQVHGEAAAIGGGVTTPFVHVVLTRFNVRLAEGAGRPSDEWLDSRIELFAQYPVRSFAAQTVSDFRWLVFFDSDTPIRIRERVSRLSEVRDPALFHAVYLDRPFDADVVSAAVRAVAPFGSVLTTRCDNDDAVAVDFIETIRAAVRPGRREFLNLTDGAQVAGDAVCRRPYTSNPFISLFEPRDATIALDTVFVDGHDVLSQRGRIREIRTGHPMWLQVVHGDNIANELVGLRTRPSAFSGYFAVALPDDPTRWTLLASRIRDVLRIGWRLLRRGRRVVELMRWLRAARLDAEVR